MQIDNRTRMIWRVFTPWYLEAISEIERNDSSFAYYTSADTAAKILKNKEIWFRNARLMNDYSEIEYGLKLLRDALGLSEGERFEAAVEGVFEGVNLQLGQILNNRLGDWVEHTYIACISEHSDVENSIGRLSM